jgi:nucleotide-binding universal stress UspA family protein
VKIRGPILCATDLSAAAGEALRQGAELASQLRTSLVVGHVLPEAFNVRVLFPQDAGVDTAVHEELERKAVAALRAQLGGVAGAAESTTVEIETGTAHAGIVSLAERVAAGLIVVGPGATAQRVARSWTGPVLIARPSPTGGGVLGATDFSDPSLPALHMAATEAARRGSRLRIVHCLDLDEAAYVAGTGLAGVMAPWPLPAAIMDNLEASAREKLSDALTQLNVVSEGVVVRRPPAAGIIDAAETVATALIVVGSRGRTGLSRLAMGSVAEAVVDRAPCSVLVVPLHPA